MNNDYELRLKRLEITEEKHHATIQQLQRQIKELLQKLTDLGSQVAKTS